MSKSRKASKSTPNDVGSIIKERSDERAAIIDYIIKKVEWKCVLFISAPNADQLLICKGQDKEVDLPQMEKGDPEITHDMEEKITGFLMSLGSTIPMCFIGDGTRCQLTYGRTSVKLDYSHPDFFDHLDELLDWLSWHDDLSGFSSRSQNVACQDPHFEL